MRVLHLSSYDLYGGAARAAYRLHTTLRLQGVDSFMLVRQRRSDRADVILSSGPGRWIWRRIQRRLDRIPVALRGLPSGNFSPAWIPDGLESQIKSIAPDLIHIHWTCDGFFRPESLLQVRVPVVWTMHDMWAFTGGCHYSGPCQRFLARCGNCPVLESGREQDLSRTGWERRDKIFSRKSVSFVAPSRWIERKAKASSLLADGRVETIYYGINTDTYRPMERIAARVGWDLPGDGIVILLGAVGLKESPRKGFRDFLAALAALRGEISCGSIRVILFGTAREELNEFEGFRFQSVGVINNEGRLASLYAAADLFVAPSIEDNLPNTLLEAMSCGTPAVAYNVGGIPEIVDHGTNGLLAAAGDISSLAEALRRMIEDKVFRQECGRNARDKVLQSFAQERSADAYRELYKERLGAVAEPAVD